MYRKALTSGSLSKHAFLGEKLPIIPSSHDGFMTNDSFVTKLQALPLNREGPVELCHQNTSRGISPKNVCFRAF